MGVFNAPRIIGGGQIQHPREANAMSDIQDATFKAADMKQKQGEYDRDFYENAVTQNQRKKWLEQQHRSQAYKEYAIKPPTRTNKETGEIEEIPFPEVYEYKNPDMGTKYSTDNYIAEYNEYLKSVNNSQGFGGLNPLDGMWYPGKGLIQNIKEKRARRATEKAANLNDPATNSYGPQEEEHYESEFPYQSTGQYIGDEIPSFLGNQKGSYIRGNRTGDKNPAMLEDGEYVLNRNAVNGLGKGWLDHVNNKEYPRFQHGGTVGGFDQPDNTGGRGHVVDPMQGTAFDPILDMIAGMVGGEGMQSGGFMIPDNTGGTGDIVKPTQGSAFDPINEMLGKAMSAEQDGGIDTGGTDAGPGSMDLATAEGDPMYESIMDDVYDFDFGATYAQRGGYVPGYQVGGGAPKLRNPYEYQDMVEQGSYDRWQESLRGGYENRVARQMERDLKEKGLTKESWDDIHKQRLSDFNPFNPMTYGHVLDAGTGWALDKVGGATGWWPSLSQIEKEQKSEADRWEETPFPGKLPMTKDDVAWRQETYHPENSFWDFGRTNITNDRMIDALNKMK